MYFAVRLYWRCRTRRRVGFELENTDHGISLLRTNELGFEFYIVINIQIICFDVELTKETMNCFKFSYYTHSDHIRSKCL